MTDNAKQPVIVPCSGVPSIVGTPLPSLLRMPETTLFAVLQYLGLFIGSIFIIVAVYGIVRRGMKKTRRDTRSARDEDAREE